MSTPPRKHSPSVYRRRRLVVLLGLLLVIAVVWLLIAQPWRGSAEPAARPAVTTATPSPTPTVSVTPTPTPTPTPSGTPTIGPCDANVMTVESVTDSEVYASGVNPQLSIRLTNTGAVPCVINVGTSSQKFTISSGNDVWWRSTDCQTEPSDMIVTLTPGQVVESTAPLTWDRTRSNVSSCDAGDRERAPGGGASYHLGVEIGGIASESSKQFQLE